MAADANLIRGARDAASGAGKMTMAGGELGRTAQGLIGRVDARTADLRKRTEEAKERGRKKDEKFDENTEASLTQAGALGDAEYEFTRRKVDKLQQEYQECAWHDDACKKRVMMGLSKESQGLTSMKDTRALNAKALLNLRGDVSREQQEVMGIYANSQSGKYDIVEGKDGEIRYTFDLGEDKEASYTKNELDKMFEAQKDSVGMEETKKRGIANLERGKTGEAYSEEQEGAAFDSLTKTDNSLRSYLNDEWLGGENFSGSMDSKIKSDIEALKSNPNIQNLDIPIGDGETNWYDNITEEDTALIKQKLMNPQTEEEIRSARLVAKQHYIDAQRQQHAKGVKEAENARLAAQQKEINKMALETHKGNVKIAVGNAASVNDMNEIVKKATIEAGEVTESTKTQVIKGAEKVDLVNTNWKKGDPKEEKNLIGVSSDQLKAIDKGLADPNVRGTVGNFGYYYKDAQGNYRQFKNKQHFIKKQKIKVKGNETEDEAIARFNASKGNTGVAGGKGTSLATIRSDEQLDAADDQIIDVTSKTKKYNPALGLLPGIVRK